MHSCNVWRGKNDGVRILVYPQGGRWTHLLFKIVLTSMKALVFKYETNGMETEQT